jgi:predicted transcriptional regulator
MIESSAITIKLPDEQLSKLKEMAGKLGVTPEALIRLSVDELLARPDSTFEEAATKVLEKNAELYRRLA